MGYKVFLKMVKCAEFVWGNLFKNTPLENQVAVEGIKLSWLLRGWIFKDGIWVKVDQNYVEGQALALAMLDVMVIVPEDQLVWFDTFCVVSLLMV